MSDIYLRLIPTEPTWLPGSEALQRAIITLSTLAPDAESVEAKVRDEVTFVDQGSNFERLVCPVCRAELEMDWWSDRMDGAGDAAFTSLGVTTPCCRVRTSLNDLVYDWPAGFARAELSVMNPQRGWLEVDELARVAAELGHPLRQVMAHY